MRESVIEKKLRIAVESKGGKCKKFVSPGSRGEPDRICLFLEERIFFVETKAPGKKPTPLQLKKHRELRELGFKVIIIDTLEDVEQFIKEVVRDEVHST